MVRANQYILVLISIVSTYFLAISLGSKFSTTSPLVLTQSNSISLDKEDLYLSEQEVRVDYVFTNTSAKDIDTLVVFPFPDQVFKDEDDYFIRGLDDKKKSRRRLMESQSNWSTRKRPC